MSSPPQVQQNGAAAAPAPAPAVAPAADVVQTSPLQRWLSRSLVGTLKRHGWATIKYLVTTEVHTYAFSVAANAILSFVPAVVMLMTLSLRVFHSQAMFRAVKGILGAFLPVYRQEDFNFIFGTIYTRCVKGHSLQVFSLIMLFISCTGVFLPLEVALNKVWGFKADRSYLRNQIVSLGLALACGMLALLSIGAVAGVLVPTGGAQNLFGEYLGSGFLFRAASGINGGITFLAMKVLGLIASILVFHLVFWLLPNGKVPALAVMPAAIVTGITWVALEEVYVLFLPLLNFRDTYGPFHLSVTLIFWAYISGMLMLGGAHLSAADHIARSNPPTAPPAQESCTV